MLISSSAEPAVGRRERLDALALLIGGVALWGVGIVGGIRWQEMTDLGFVSVLPVTCLVGLGFLVAGFVRALAMPVVVPGVLRAHVVAMLVVLHATPTLVYGTMRYPWAWKHVGVIDFITRNGVVDPTIETLGAYHGWPGFFALNAMIAETTGIDAAQLGRWWPLAVNLLVVWLLSVLFAVCTDDRRVGPVACWVYVLGSWVGQDYFSPQAMAFVMYLTAVVVLVCLTAARRPVSLRLPTRTIPALTRIGAASSRAISRVGRGVRRLGPTSVRKRLGVVPREVYVVALAIACSHQLTPVMLALTCVALVVGAYAGTPWLATVIVGVGAAWAVVFAAPLLMDNADELETVGSVGSNLDGTVVDLAAVSSGQALVAASARVLTVLVVLLALVGLLREWRRGRTHGLMALLAGLPVLLVGLSSYGGEVLFRVVLFGLPALAFLVGTLLVADRSRRGGAAAVAVASAVLLPLFLLAHLGNERQYAFGQDEVALVQDLYATAPPGSLLVEGSRNYPTQSLRYGVFTYVPIDREPVDGRRRVLADPAGVLGEWLDNEAYSATYLLLTRSMVAATEASGSLPAGGIATIDAALAADPAFVELARNDAGVMWGRAPEDRVVTDAGGVGAR